MTIHETAFQNKAREKAEGRRLTALSLAVKVAAEQQVGKYDGEIVVNIAEEFEKYLKGDDTEAGEVTD